MIYSTTDVARQAQPSLQSAVSQLHQASQRVRAGMTSDKSGSTQSGTASGPAVSMTLGQSPVEKIDVSLKAMITSGLSADAVKSLAAGVGQALGQQFLAMANVAPQTLTKATAD